ncbi:MAG: hypothetical protein AAGF48_16005 [Pseudomonadota bacterium]
MSDDPRMPKTMPPHVGRAIETILEFQSTNPVEIYRAIRYALQAPEDKPSERRMTGDGRAPPQGDQR